MKGFAVVVLILMLMLTGFNWYEIHTLKQEVYTLQQNLKEQKAKSQTDDLIAKATVALGQARAAASATDWTSAKKSYDNVRMQLEMAAKTAEEKSKPAVKWIQDQAADLEKQIKDKMR